MNPENVITYMNDENAKRAGMHAGYAYQAAESAYTLKQRSKEATSKLDKAGPLKHAHKALARAYEHIQLMNLFDSAQRF